MLQELKLIRITTTNGARATIGDATVYGTWQARFVDGSRKDNMPGAVVGEFAVGNTDTDTFHMLGAFGAANQVADLPQ